MQISYSHKFIFIHIPKTAGTSVSVALSAVSHQLREQLVNRLLKKVGISVNHYGPHTWKQFRLHETALTVKRHLPTRIYDHFFKFAFVRNPWDQLVSSYHWISQNPKHGRHKLVRSLSFDEYLRYVMARGKFSQHGFILDRHERLIVDFVGRFERLAEDFAAHFAAWWGWRRRFSTTKRARGEITASTTLRPPSSWCTSTFAKTLNCWATHSTAPRPIGRSGRC